MWQYCWPYWWLSLFWYQNTHPYHAGEAFFQSLPSNIGFWACVSNASYSEYLKVLRILIVDLVIFSSDLCCNCPAASIKNPMCKPLLIFSQINKYLKTLSKQVGGCSRPFQKNFKELIFDIKKKILKDILNNVKSNYKARATVTFSI